jgi:2-methylcitrate dehydratase PrpD
MSGSDRAIDEPTDAIIHFARAVRLEHLPAAVVTHVKRLLLDGISWMVMGARRAEARELLRLRGVGPTVQPLTVIGTDRTVDVVDACFLNACFAQVHDCNDVRRLARSEGGSNHPGRGVIPFALTLAEWHGVSGRELLELLVVGYEVASRVMTHVPYHQHGAACAAMGGRAARMGDLEFRRAIRLAHLGFPLFGGWSEGGDFDFLRNGAIAESAIRAILLAPAELSITAASPPLDLQMARPLPGELPAHPEAYAITSVAIKPYPCCRSLHGAIDLMLEARRAAGFDPGRVEAVEIRVGNSQRDLFHPVPRDAHYKRCQFSIPFTVACALLDGRVDEDSFSRERIAADDVAAMQRKIEVAQDERLSYIPHGNAKFLRPTTMRIVETDGQVRSLATRSPRGSRLNPLSEEELRDKFFRWTGAAFPRSRKEEIVATVTAVEDLPQAASLLASLRTVNDG